MDRPVKPGDVAEKGESTNKKPREPFQGGTRGSVSWPLQGR